MNRYETIIVINPNLEAEDVERIVSDVQEIISGSGGIVGKVHNWGKKRLAYDVQGHRDGIYVLIYFEAEPTLIQTLARHFGLTERVIKYMTVKSEEPPEASPEATTAAAEDKDKNNDKDDDKDE